MVDIISSILILALTAFYFIILNKVFSITYFGLTGFLKFVGGCLIAAAITVVIIMDWVKAHPVWSTIIALLMIVIVVQVRRSKKLQDNEAQQVENG